MGSSTPSEPEFREIRVHASRPLSPTVRSVMLETVDQSAFHWRGGQHVELLVPREAEAPERWRGDRAWLEHARASKHPYSIASAPDRATPGRIELAVGRDERDSVSALLQRLPVGAHLGMVGPLGEFTRAGLCDEPAVFVATGTGVAPLRAMIQADLDRGVDGPELVLLFGCRGEEDLLWDDELRALAAQHRRFRYEPTLSRPSAGWTGRRGYVQQHVAEVVRPLGPVPVFVSGQSEMVGDVVRILEGDLGHPADRILRERYA